MERTIIGLAKRPVEAQKIIDDLMGLCACDRSDISLVGAEDEAGRAASGAAHAASRVGAATGHAVAASLEGILGAASQVVSRRVSGFGLLKAAGGLGLLLTKTALSTAQDVTRALSELGLDARLARQYSDALREGSVLVVVHARTERMATCARQVMSTHGALAPEPAAH